MLNKVVSRVFFVREKDLFYFFLCVFIAKIYMYVAKCLGGGPSLYFFLSSLNDAK